MPTTLAKNQIFGFLTRMFYELYVKRMFRAIEKWSVLLKLAHVSCFTANMATAEAETSALAGKTILPTLTAVKISIV